MCHPYIESATALSDSYFVCNFWKVALRYFNISSLSMMILGLPNGFIGMITALAASIFSSNFCLLTIER